MNSIKMSSALVGLKDHGADEVFDLIFTAFWDETREEGLTSEQRTLVNHLETDEEYFKRARCYHDQMFSNLQRIKLIERFSSLDQKKSHDEIIKDILFAHCDLCEIMSRKAFEYGVAYGKVLAT